ncbi:hypothetical protein [Pluralibacter gergoviae]|uniref:hypothetical protein n=1 Tax=Pluralibacter gergoviae TaxID=61647 RepID=UPI003890795B
MPLKDYIDKHFGGNNAAFARAINVDRQQVRKWINDGWIVSGRKLYSVRREMMNVPHVSPGYECSKS